VGRGAGAGVLSLCEATAGRLAEDEAAAEVWAAEGGAAGARPGAALSSRCSACWAAAESQAKPRATSLRLFLSLAVSAAHSS